MEVGTLEETPSWLSIRTKAKRFTAAVSLQVNNNESSTDDMSPSREEEDDDDDEVVEVVDGSLSAQPKKMNRKYRQQMPNSNVSHEEGEEDDHHHSPKKVRVAVIDGSSRCTSTSSSPSPGLLSCGSSAEDDASSSVSTSTLSAFSSSSPSPKQFAVGGMEIMALSGLPPRSYQDLVFEDNRRLLSNNPGGERMSNTSHTTTALGFRPHSLNGNNFQDFRDRLPEISISPLPLSNQISVIKSTRSFLRGGHNLEDESEEPQDLSINKPKRFATTSSISCNSNNSNTTNSTALNFSTPKLNMDDARDECVQDLSLRVPSNSFNNSNSAITITTSTPTNNRTGPISNRMIIVNSSTKNFTPICRDQKQQQKPQKKVAVKVSSLIFSDSNNSLSPSKLKFEQSEDSNTSSVSSSLPNNSQVISSSSNNLTNNDEEGEMVIVDVSPSFKTVNNPLIGISSVSTTTDADSHPKKFIQQQYIAPIPVDTKPQINGKMHDTKNETSMIKEIDTETGNDVEINKSRRGRKRKDEEAIGNT